MVLPLSWFEPAKGTFVTDYFRDRDYSHSPRDPDGRPYGEVDPATLNWDLGRPLIDHLNGTAGLAKLYGAKLDMAEYAYWLGLWHDLGKYRPNFQDYLRGLKRFTNYEDKSHKWAGAAWANHIPRGKLIAWLIGSHHGGLHDKNDLPDLLKHQGQTELDEVLATGRVPAALLHKPTLSLPPQLSGQFPKVTLELFLRFLFSMLVDADHSDTAAHFDPDLATTRTDLAEQQNTLAELKHKLDTHMAGFQNAPDTLVNRMRAEVLHHCRGAAGQSAGCFSLTVPTGGGKTLASMAFALDHALANSTQGGQPFERIIVVLPFTSIIAQSAQVYRDIFGEANVLEHHANWEADEGDPGDRARADYRHKLLCENWDAPIIVTTAVQFLETLHAHKPSRCRKLHRVLNSVIVMDEVQTLPTELLHVTLDTLASLVLDFHTSLVLCTATQPVLSDPDLVAGLYEIDNPHYHHVLPPPKPIIPPVVEQRLFEQMRRVRVHPPREAEHPADWSALVARAKAQAEAHGQVLVIVDRRQAAFELAKLLDEGWLFLCGNMLPAHRLWVIDEVKRRLAAGDPCQLVSTQMIEAGVDVDFPVVFRALAGYDALAQSAGRCNRNGLRRDEDGNAIPGDFYVFLGPKPPPKGLLRTGYELARSGFLNGTVDLGDPQLFPTYFRQFYGRAPTDGTNLMPLRSDFSLRRLGENYQLINNDQQVPVVVPWPAEALADLYPKGERRDKAVARQKRMLAAFTQYRKGTPAKGDMRLLRQMVVSIPTAAARGLAAERAVLPLHANCPMLFLDLEVYSQYYDKRLGFCYFEECQFDQDYFMA